MTDSLPIEPLDELDGLFALPDSFDDAELRRAYEVLVVKLRRELQAALAKSPTTLQLLVCERTALNYILIKKKDKVGVGPLHGWRHMTEVKEFNAFWMGLAETLNKMMIAGQADYRDSLLAQVGSAVNGVLKELVPDDQERAAMRSRIGAELASVGL